jgi:putative ABC transport system permease protein
MPGRLLLASLRMALGSLRRAVLRSTLTALGILIGIAAVVVVTALATGARERIGSQIQSLGSNLLFVFNQPTAKSGARVVVSQGLTDGDAEAIRREAGAIDQVAVYSDLKAQVVSELGNTKTDVMGVDRHYFAVRSFSVQRGRMFTESEELIKAKVCLIGPNAAQALFGSTDPVGRYVRIGRHAFQIVGMTAPKGQSPFEDQDDRILMPIGTWRSRVSPTLGRRVQLIMATAKSAAEVGQAERQIDAILRQRHRVAESEEPDFRLRTQEAFRESQEAIFRILSILLLSVAAVALFSGGVGVMNIMLVSVTERTREIGIRMAIGARRQDIQLQFLAEAVALTALGGLAGIAVATGVMHLMRRTLGWSMQLSPEAVAVAVATSFAVGLIFGFLPARRAAALDPIEALRHE